jgi:glutamate 5-kinase
MKKKYQKIIVKIGTNVITKDDGLLDLQVMQNLVRQIAELKKSGVEVIVVSSGAMGAGRSMLTISDKSNDVVKRQILAAVGQPKLINTYAKLFAEHHYVCAQILATKEDFRDRIHYLNMKNCFTALLQDNIVPIVNENDVVSVTELMFTDNDELAGLIASMMNVEALILLTNVDGIFDGNPNDAGSRLVPTIDSNESNFRSYVSPEKSLFGRGGMLTKCGIGHKMALVGITTHIANGKGENTLLDIYNKKQVGTTFLLQKDASSVKRWIAHSEGFEKGTVYINHGAAIALASKDKAISLLPVGIVKIDGNFEKGDIIRICNEKNDNIGLGLAQYNSQKAVSLVGQKGQKPLIHYDYLFLKV